jgi:Domain of unknown function (DUF5664)
MDLERNKTVDESTGIETNELGGKQSHIGTCFRCLPFDALERVAKVAEQGRVKYGLDNWKLISSHEHIEHAIRHSFEGIDTRLGNTEDVLAHAVVRLLFAMHLEGKEQKQQNDVILQDPRTGINVNVTNQFNKD